MKLVNLISSNLGYFFEKIYGGYYGTNDMPEDSLYLLKENYESIKIELLKRYGSLNAYPGISSILNKMDYIFSQIGGWVSSGMFQNNKDAEIFLDGLYDRFQELKGMLIELDES